MRSPQPSQPCTRRQSWRSSSEPNWPSAMNCCASFTSRHGSSVPKPKLSLNGSESSEGVSGARMELAGDTRQADRPARPRPAPRPRARTRRARDLVLYQMCYSGPDPATPTTLSREILLFIYHILYEFRAGQPQPKGTRTASETNHMVRTAKTTPRHDSRAELPSDLSEQASPSRRAGRGGTASAATPTEQPTRSRPRTPRMPCGMASPDDTLSPAAGRLGLASSSASVRSRDATGLDQTELDSALCSRRLAPPPGLFSPTDPTTTRSLRAWATPSRPSRRRKSSRRTTRRRKSRRCP